ncbi:MAG: hypothetical protein EAX95_11485 [Candidatus Thorarchaeota archaeon]|nr:hypothetical protein [Candidatus Thorarchaeota archaeon]
MTKAEDVWDLSQMVEFDDPGYVIEQLTYAVSVCGEFRERHHGKISRYDAQQLLNMLQEMDMLELQFEGPMNYAYLTYQADMNAESAANLMNKYENTASEIGQVMAFVEIEIGKLLMDTPDIMENPLIAKYKHFLEIIKRRTPHMLSEDMEQAIIAKDLNGIRSWNRLFGDWLATRRFEIEIDGKIKSMPFTEIVQLYMSPNRDLRRRTNEIVFGTLKQDILLWSSAMRAIMSDHIQVTKMRKWASPMEQSFIANDVDEETISSLLNTIDKNTHVLQKYLGLKAKVLGLEKLGNWDIEAPLPDAPAMKFSWNESRTLVVEAYTDFDEEVGSWIDEMFEKRHIDGRVRPGKRSGAFCHTWHAGKSAYILQSFSGILGDVFTQAHELGHSMHAYLGTRAQTPLNYQIGMCIAETGSIFGTLLLTEKLLGSAKSKEEKQAILASILDDFGEAAFQVSARVFFETSFYEAIEQGKFLDGEKIADLWVAARNRIYGDAVEWLPDMRYWWTFKLHFYIPNFRFYNYPYVYAQLFVYAMYRLYKEQGKEFVPKLKALLAAGSSRSPRDLAAEIGFDISSEEFWQKGIDQYAEFIKMFEETI